MNIIKNLSWEFAGGMFLILLIWVAILGLPVLVVVLYEEGKKNMDKKCCGNCQYHEYEDISQGFVCGNDKSEYVADWTEYNHCCEEWEGKPEEAQSNFYSERFNRVM